MPRSDQVDFIEAAIKELVRRGVVFESPWLSPKKAAGYLDMSESKLNRLRVEGKGPAFRRVGEVHISKKGKNRGKAHNLVRYNRNDLDNWMSQFAIREK